MSVASLPDPSSSGSLGAPAGIDASPFRDAVRSIIGDFLTDPLALPDQFKAWLPNYLETNPPLLPISQISGFQQFTAAVLSITANEGTSASVYGDLATVGPQATVLADGNYVILYGVRMVGDGVVGLRASIQVNSTVAVDSDSVNLAATSLGYGVKALVKPLSNGGNNTVKIVYRASAGGGAATFGDRWLMALRYSNL